MNVLILELKLYCGPEKFYGRSKFGQYDEVNDRAPFVYYWILCWFSQVLHTGKISHCIMLVLEALYSEGKFKTDEN